LTLQLQHPFTSIVAGPSICGNSTFVIWFTECRDLLCGTVYKNIIWCRSENNVPHHFIGVSFVKGVPDFNNPENMPTIRVLDDWMDSVYST